MLIQCTKKLLDELWVKAAEKEEKKPPLFSWHANLIKINGKKCVVLMNDKNRYVIVLYGLKARDFKNMDELITGAVWETFRDECIKDEIIEKFIKNAGKITYSKTGDKSTVAKLNYACDEVKLFELLLDSGSIYQPLLSRRVSTSLVGSGSEDKYFWPYEEMYEDLKSLGEDDIFSFRAAVLKVTLELMNHEVWRRIVVPLNMTFNGLHQVLQASFDWRGYHLHDFIIFDGEEPVLNLVCDKETFDFPMEDMEMRLEHGVRLYEYIPRFRRINYTYDFGDNWEHRIEVEKVIEDYDANYPVCLEGKGNTPPEDVGGEPGYEEFLEIINDKSHPEHEEMVEWGEMQGYEDFDIEKVNRMMKR